MTIHPTSIVHKKATVHESCTVGPYCVIGPDVALGPDTCLVSHVVIDGSTTIGVGNQFFPFASIGTAAQGQERVAPGEITIGDLNTFREGVTVQGSARGGSTIIKDRNLFFANTHIAHDCILGSNILINNGSNLGGHVVIRDGVQISAGVGIHQYVHVGSCSFIAAGSMVDKSILPFVMAEGNRARIRSHNKVGLQRAGWTLQDQIIIKKLVRAYLFRGLRGLERATEILAPPQVIVMKIKEITLNSTRPLAPRRQLKHLAESNRNCIPITK